MELRDAERYARNVAEWLRPACARIVVCGSIRRKKPEVKDIELVVELAAEARPVFGEPASARSSLDGLLAKLVRQGALSWDSELKRNGPKYKRLKVAAYSVAVDLFIANPQNWGYIVAIRTGDADFSRALVLKESAGGLMPRGYFHHEGYLKHLDLGLVPVPTEESYFHTLELDVPPPEERTSALAARLAGARRVRA